MSIIQSSKYKIHEQFGQSRIIKAISSCKDVQQFMQIDDQLVIECLRRNFQQNLNQHNQQFNFLRENAFFMMLKNWSKAYDQLAAFLSQSKDNAMNSYSVVSNLQSNTHKNQCSQQEPNKRKVTRLFHAMRNVKNQQQLKKDQIFVRLVPRSQSCIQFMLNNRNFPRIQLKLSCNQHLQYLVNYLTNKWLRGKVGVGYQIVLYPDPSIFLKKNKNHHQKRSQVIHQPLNNYLMLTDVMSGYGSTQNACINLYYDITEFRKEKNKMIQKQKEYFVNNFQQQNSPQRTPTKSVQENVRPLSIQRKIQQNVKEYLQNSLDEHSLNIKGFQRKFGTNNLQENIDHNTLNQRHAVEEQDYGSLAFNWNLYNSNIGASNHLFYNSNTFHNPLLTLNGQKQKKIEKQEQIIQQKQIEQNIGDESRKSSSRSQKNKDSIKSGSDPQIQSQQGNVDRVDKLDHIRNVISMIGDKSHPLQEKEENQVQNQRSNSNVPLKEVKMVKIIKKKN